MKLVPCTRELLELAARLDRDHAVAQLSDVGPQHLQPGLAWAFMDGPYLLGCGGVIMPWPGRAVAFMRVTSFARPRDVVRGLRWARKYLDGLQQHEFFRRIEIHVRCDAPFCRTLAKALGFAAPEAVMKAFGPDGADYFLFSRVA